MSVVYRLRGYFRVLGGLRLLAGVSAIVVSSFALASSDVRPKVKQRMDELFEDDRIQVRAPEDWSVTPIFQRESGLSSRRVHIGAVMRNGPWRIYLLTHYGQTSGITGGRFGEIAPYVAPWMKAADPWGCIDVLTRTETRLSPRWTRVDLAYPPAPRHRGVFPECLTVHKQVDHPVWFGSYFTSTCTGRKNLDKTCGGFFVPFPQSRGLETAVSPEEMVVTATEAISDAEKLPEANDSALAAFLKEASLIVESVKYQ